MNQFMAINLTNYIKGRNSLTKQIQLSCKKKYKLNSLICIFSIEIVVLNLLTKKTPNPDGITGKF